jgi:putative membrane-bound dehydrogenase-like protein
MKPMTHPTLNVRARLTVALAATALVALPLAAQDPGAAHGPAPAPSTGPTLAPRGAIAPNPARDSGVLAQVTVPPGFSLKMFAGPPVAMYPTVVAPAPDGSVYMGTDLNLAQGAVKGRGRIIRLVDTNGDGKADHYSVFAKVDSPRGIAVDGNTVYVLHVPELTAYRDTNGDGIADKADTIVRNLGFGLDVRSSDHSTNNIALGIDGWIYVAAGDYGYLNAKGKDGTTITHRGGSVVRVRPDGTGLEIFAVGTRNIYDVAIDPFGRIYSRDNTNDGLGWDTRLHYIAPNANMGYPQLFRNFADEHMPSMFDYGPGAGTGGMWMEDPGFPDEWNNALYTGDWTMNKVFRHKLTPKGASFTPDQTDFIVAPRVVDVAMDDRSHVYVASLVGGVFNYAGDTVGAILQVGYPGRRPSAPLNASKLSDTKLLAALGDPNLVHRIEAEREIVRRGAKAATLRELARQIADTKRSTEARVAAMFTLELVGGKSALPALQKAASDTALRAVALKAISESPALRSSAPVTLYANGLTDSDPAVRVQAIAAIVRTNAVAQAPAVAKLLSDTDPAVAHLAARGLAALGARDAALNALTTGPASARSHARMALQLMHDTATVSALVSALGSASDPDVKHELVLTLARLDNDEAPWNGDWWGTQPSTIGPYYIPTEWAGSAKIQPVLQNLLASASGPAFDQLVDDYAKNRVLPLGSKALFASADPATRTQLVNALTGHSGIPGSAAALLARIDASSAASHTAVAQLFGGENGLATELAPLATKIISDTTLSAEVRGQALAAVGRISGDQGLPAAIAVFSQVTPSAPVAMTPAAAAAAGPPTPAAANPVDLAWRRFIGARERTFQLDKFIALAHSSDPAERRLGYSVLVQSVRNPRYTPEFVRNAVAPVLSSAWSDPAAAASLVQAIRIMRVDAQYADQLKAYDSHGGGQ